MPYGAPHPTKLVADVVDTVLDVVTFPSTVIRAAKHGVRTLNHGVYASARQGNMPDPINLIDGIANTVINGVLEPINDVSQRLSNYKL